MINCGWKKYLHDEFNKEYFVSLKKFIFNEIENGKVIFPPKDLWFKSLSIPPENVRIIIIGQDPYHGKNQANGFSFSVNSGVKLPPSLRNIYKEIENETSLKMNFDNGNLTSWVNQGVLLLNTVFTVEEGKPGSHSGIGWEIFTSKIIEVLSKNFDKNVFFLWGNFAKTKKNLIDKDKNLILESAHPSPFSAHSGFFGNNHFMLANKYLESVGKNKIDWIIR